MKSTFRASSFLLFTIISSHAAYAELPVILLGPNPPIAQQINAGDGATSEFTLQNNVPRMSAPLTISGFDANMSRISVPNDCNNTLPRGPATCNIGFRITTTSSDAGQSFIEQLIIDYQDRVPFTANVEFIVSSNPIVQVAVGEDLDNHKLIIASSLNGVWAMRNSGFPVFDRSSRLQSVSCIGNGTNAHCVAVGAIDFEGKNSKALITVSTDGGITWIPRVSPQTHNFDAVLNSVSCVGKGQTGICAAVGQKNSGSPMIVESRDGGMSWQEAPIHEGSTDMDFLQSVSCTGNEKDNLCAATYVNTPGHIVDRNRAGDWVKKKINNLTISFTNIVGCAGHGSTAICAGGSSEVPNGFVAVGKHNKGSFTWNGVKFSPQPPPEPPQPPLLNFYGASCTGFAPSSICVLAGNTFNFPLKPAVAVSSDAGNTWKTIIVGQENPDWLGAVDCTGGSKTPLCVAVGPPSIVTREPTLIFVSNAPTQEQGWTKKTFPGMTPTGYLNSVTCSGHGSNAICAIGGSESTNDIPVIVQSTDGGNTWAKVTPPGAPAKGVFYGTGGTL